MTKALVTGAAGFLGFHLARALANRSGFEVVCVDNFIRGEKDSHFAELISRPNVTAISIDLTDRAAVDSLPADVDFIYHLAALNGTQNFYERPFEVIRCCTLPTLFLIEHYGPLNRVKRFIYAGSSEAYASTVTRFNWEVPTAEDVPLGIDDVKNPRWSYAGSKIHGEIVTMQGGRAYDLPVSVIRYHNAYGPRMGDKHVIPDFYARVNSGVYELYGYEDTRSFLYVDDSVRATIMAAETQACANEIINVGSEREIRIQDLGESMLRVRNLEHPIALHPSPSGSVKRRAPNISKLKKLTGFVETVSLERGLAATADFYLDGNLADALSPHPKYRV